MRAGVMSAGIFGIANRVRPAIQERELHEEAQARATGWSEEAFARQQIRNLTRQVFSSGREDVRHVVFGGADVGVNVNDVCLRVANALSFERQEDVLVVLSYEAESSDTRVSWAEPIRSCAARLSRNLWQLSVPRSFSADIDGHDSRSLMEAIRNEFGFSIVACSILNSTREDSLAECADGMVLVISALRTRRAAARKLLDDLAHIRVLGTVLQDREFPIPEGIYRRL